MADEGADPARPHRAARDRAPPVVQRAEFMLPSGPSGRPTAAENVEAKELIDAMVKVQQVRGKGVGITTNVIALALAFERNDPELHGLSQKQSDELFGAPRSRVHDEWVHDERLQVARDYLACDPAQRDAFVAPLVASARERLARRAQRRQERAQLGAPRCPGARRVLRPAWSPALPRPRPRRHVRRAAAAATPAAASAQSAPAPPCRAGCCAGGRRADYGMGHNETCRQEQTLGQTVRAAPQSAGDASEPNAKRCTRTRKIYRHRFF
jgi:hypothetical protein